MSSLPPDGSAGSPPPATPPPATPPPAGVPPQDPNWRSPQQYPAAREGRGASFFVAIFLGILLLVSGALNVMLLVLSIGSFAGAGLTGGTDEYGAMYDIVRTGGDAEATHKVLRIKIHGAIAESENPVLGGSGGSVSNVRRALEYAARDDAIAGILLDIDSPGGGVTDSDTIYRMLRRYKAEHEHVRIIALFGDIAASGGYYVAAAADRIFARPTTITGSIGVIMSAWNFAGLAKQLGIEQVAIISEKTPYKDMLSPTRPVDPAEKAILTSIVEELYDKFVDVVDFGRVNLDKQQVEALANGAIYSAGQAFSNGLIDEIGDPVSVQDWFVDSLGGPIQVVEYRRRPTLRDMLFGVKAPEPLSASQALGSLVTAGSGPRFLYYWQGAR